MKWPERAPATTLSITLLLFALASAPSATAQSQPLEPTLEIGECSGLDHGRLPVEVATARCPIRINVATPPASACASAVRYDFRVTVAPPYATARVVPSTFTETYPAQSAGGPTTHEMRQNVTLQVAVSRDAPALNNGLYEVRVKVSAGDVAGGCMWSPGEATDEKTIMNDYLALLWVGPRLHAVRAAPDSVAEVPVGVKNQGNGNTRVALTAVPWEDTMGSTSVPGPFTMASPIEGIRESAERVVTVGVHVPREPGTYTLSIIVNGTFAGPVEEPLAGFEEARDYSIEVRPTSAGQTPSLGPVGVALSLLVGGAIVGLHRRHHRG